ncbi:hypothetical protein J2X43_003285 [Rhizobium sp. BE258]|nr:hypothetical protein [Rhizobium sp. BE258]
MTIALKGKVVSPGDATVVELGARRCFRWKSSEPRG